VELVRCGGCEDERVVRHDLADGVFVGVELPAGRYVVTSTFDSEADARALEFTIERRG